MTEDSLLPKSRVCSKCGEEKLLEEFYKNKMNKHGRESHCKLCDKQRKQDNKEHLAKQRKQYYEDNKEKLNEVSKKYKEENKEQIKKRQADRLKNLIENDLLPKSKVCTQCTKEKLLEEFHKHTGCKYGVESRCTACRAKYKKQYIQDNPEIQKKRVEYGKQYRQNNKDAVSEYAKQYCEANKEKIKEREKQYRKANKEERKQYYETNKERITEQRRQHYEANKERLLEHNKQYYQVNRERLLEHNKQYYQNNKEKVKQYRQNNRERSNEYEKNRRKNDEQFRIRRNLSAGLWQALNKIGKTKNASILTYIGCSIGFMKEYLNSTKKPDWGNDLHIDHIIPKSLFDHTNEEEIKKCWNWRNLRYLPAEENMNKHDTLDMDLVKSYGIEDLLPEGVDK